jgi:hypothetical protein
MIMIVKRIILHICIYTLFLACFNYNALAKDNKNTQTTKLKDLVAKPKDFLNKRINIEGEFHSFSSLSLDYPKALKSSKEYIGIILSRPDENEIPLVELKISVPVEMFKSEDISIEHGDKLRLNTKVYAVALGEPWLEVKSLEILEKAEKEEK